MKYKGFVFDINPKGFKLSAQKNIAKTNLPSSGFVNQELNNKGLVVTGNGSFIGKDAMEKAHLLLRLFNKKGSDFLFLPTGDVVKAYFSDMSITYSASLEKVDYTFEFVEDGPSKNALHSFGYTLAKENENLFDVSNRTGVEIDKLASINHVQSIFAVSEGDKIWLM